MRLPLRLGLPLRLWILPRSLGRRLTAGPGLRLALRLLRVRPRRLRLRLRVLPGRLRLRRRRGRPVRPGIIALRRHLLARRRPGNVERVGRRRAPGIGRRKGIILRVGRRRHHRHVGHRFRLQLDDPRFELCVDAPEQRPHIEIEQRAIGVHHPAGLGPGRQRVKRALLERLHDIGTRAESRGKLHFGQSGRGPQVSKQLRHLSVIAGWHFLYPVNMQSPSCGVRVWA